MSDVATTAKPGFDFSPAKIFDLIKKSDLGLAIGIMAILVVLILPLPTLLLDISLAFSLSFSILILMTAVFIRKPLEFSSFPTILLITTMLRLALNLASTRLILGHGNEGTAASGYVIQAFGKLIMQGNFVIGLIVFSILIIVNFIVITKGSGRIAEVAARFSLDAMPGKQMAIDADLSAGLIDEKEAKHRRKTIEAESNFFGAMDGASKFVRGDAVAGLMIVGINIVGGIIIAVAQKGMSFADASQTFTLLSVGDGLVSQMPALIISTAAGLMVSKAGVEGATDKALMSQLSFYPQALGMAAGVMGIVAVLPGMPTLVFAGLAGGTGTLAWYAHKRKNARAAQVVAETEKAAGPPKEEPISTALALDLLRIELGYGLLPLINDVQGHRITDQIKALRRQLAQEMGFVMPAVRILDNMQLGANEYRIRIKEFDSGKGELFPGSFLIMDPKGLPIDLPGTHTTEPAFGLPATWVQRQSERRSLVPRLYRGRSRHRADHPSDRSAQEPHGRASVLRRNQKAAGRPAPGEQEAGGRTHPLADFRHRHPARAADPAQRARLHPRPAGHPGRHRRSGGPYQERALYHRTCARPSGAPALPCQPLAGRLSAAGCAVTQLGTGLCRIHHRPGRRAPARHGAVQAAAVHPIRARSL